MKKYILFTVLWGFGLATAQGAEINNVDRQLKDRGLLQLVQGSVETQVYAEEGQIEYHLRMADDVRIIHDKGEENSLVIESHATTEGYRFGHSVNRFKHYGCQTYLVKENQEWKADYSVCEDYSQ
ncbi:MAG: hypothetical protein WCG27_09565 [Pseudomonadota bacterium]